MAILRTRVIVPIMSKLELRFCDFGRSRRRLPRAYRTALGQTYLPAYRPPPSGGLNHANKVFRERRCGIPADVSSRNENIGPYLASAHGAGIRDRTTAQR